MSTHLRAAPATHGTNGSKIIGSTATPGYSHHLLSPRYSELMIPVYTPGVTNQAYLWYNVQWDAAFATLIIPLNEQSGRSS